MPIYSYRAKNALDKEVQGQLYAETHHELAKKLSDQKLFLVYWKEISTIIENKSSTEETKEKPQKQKKSPVQARTSRMYDETPLKVKNAHPKDIAIATRQMAISLKSGILLNDVLQVIIIQTDNLEIRETFKKIRERILAGSPLSATLSDFLELFSPMYINMVLAGESGGFLPDALEKMAEYLENQIRLKNELRNSLIYPCFISFVALGTLFFMATFIIPTFASIYSDLGQELPFFTKALIFICDTLRKQWFPELIIAVILFFWIRSKAKKFGRDVGFDRFVLSVPVIGPLIQKVVISRFIGTLGTLIQSGVPILEAIEISRGVVVNTAIELEIESMIENVRSGRPISEQMFNSKFFPLLVSNMVATGEQTGKLPETMAVATKYYDEEVKSSVKDIFTAIEPIFILVLGIMVGSIAVAMLLPILSLPSSIQ